VIDDAYAENCGYTIRRNIANSQAGELPVYDSITWQDGPVLTVPPGLSAQALICVVQNYMRGVVDGERQGREQAFTDLRELIGATSNTEASP
jgi:hypothetical protein